MRRTYAVFAGRIKLGRGSFTSPRPSMRRLLRLDSGLPWERGERERGGLPCCWYGVPVRERSSSLWLLLEALLEGTFLAICVIESEREGKGL